MHVETTLQKETVGFCFLNFIRIVETTRSKSVVLIRFETFAFWGKVLLLLVANHQIAYWPREAQLKADSAPCDVHLGENSRESSFAAAENRILQTEWRRGWDSNPRYGSPYARFRGEYFQPLSHLSAVVANCILADLCSRRLWLLERGVAATSQRVQKIQRTRRTRKTGRTPGETSGERRRRPGEGKRNPGQERRR
jgi:hypothetical protein